MSNQKSTETDICQRSVLPRPAGPDECRALTGVCSTRLSNIEGPMTGNSLWPELPLSAWIANAVPFEQDRTHAQYDRDYAARFQQVLVQAARVMNEFRARFIGKVSPVHFFWGSFDLAVTRFSGRTAPPPTGVTPNVASRVM